MSLTIDNNLSMSSILHNAIKRYETLCPHHSALTAVAQKSNINYKKLERALRNEAELTVQELGAVLTICCYPEGFEELKHFYFPGLK
jgi:DNA-binding phage protein